MISNDAASYCIKKKNKFKGASINEELDGITVPIENRNIHSLFIYVFLNTASIFIILEQISYFLK